MHLAHSACIVSAKQHQDPFFSNSEYSIDNKHYPDMKIYHSVVSLPVKFDNYLRNSFFSDVAKKLLFVYVAKDANCACVLETIFDVPTGGN
jgi:hypothetical protein